MEANGRELVRRDAQVVNHHAAPADQQRPLQGVCEERGATLNTRSSAAPQVIPERPLVSLEPKGLLLLLHQPLADCYAQVFRYGGRAPCVHVEVHTGLH